VEGVPREILKNLCPRMAPSYDKYVEGERTERSEGLMDCHKYELYVVALALGERNGLPKAAVAETETHIGECAACRKAYEQTRGLAPLLKPDPETVRLMVTAPNAPRIMAAIEQDAARSRTMRLALIAASILIGVGLVGLAWISVRTFSRQPEPQRMVARSNEAVKKAPERIVRPIAPAPAPIVPAPRVSALEESFLAANTPGEAFKLLQSAFDVEKARKDGHGDNLPIIIALCAKLKEKWPITNEAYYSMKLASRCWTQLGEAQKAQEVYIAYADYNGELERRQELLRGKTPEQAEAAAVEIASREILGEAETLFAERDYIRSLSYCDVLMTRYSTHKRGLLALRLVGEYSAKHRQYEEAIRVFKQVIELNPDSRAADLARMSLPSALANSGRYEEASQVWLDCAALAKTKHEQANYTVNAGGMLAVGGEKYDKAATALFEKVIKDYPDEREWVVMARRSMDRIRMRPFKKELRGVGNPLDILK